MQPPIHMSTQKAPLQTVAFRLACMLRRLNEGKKLHPEELAKEFSVTLRTIQRDLNEKLAFLELEHSDGYFAVNPARLGLLSIKDVERFAELAGLEGLHPRLFSDILQDLLNTRFQNALLVRGPNYEDLSGLELQFSQLKEAIANHCTVGFRYQKADGPKSVNDVKPYQLVNHDGIWYLAAMDGEQLKAYTFTKMEGLLLNKDDHFEPDPSVIQRLEEEDSIWLNFVKTEVVLKINREMASYFQRRKLIGGQKIVKELEDGGLIVSGQIAHPNQIWPTVRAWLPHVRIISPEHLQTELNEQLRAYLETH